MFLFCRLCGQRMYIIVPAIKLLPGGTYNTVNVYDRRVRIRWHFKFTSILIYVPTICSVITLQRYFVYLCKSLCFRWYIMHTDYSSNSSIVRDTLFKYSCTYADYNWFFKWFKFENTYVFEKLVKLTITIKIQILKKNIYRYFKIFLIC